MFFFFQLRTDYLQSQFYTGMRKAADTTLNQQAGLLWSVRKQRMSSLLKHQHTSTKKNQILVFQDGTEVPEDFVLPTYTRKKGTKYPYKAKASEKLYLLHTSERKGIGSNIYRHHFLDDLQYFDDMMDDFAFHIVNFRHILTCTTKKTWCQFFKRWIALSTR